MGQHALSTDGQQRMAYPASTEIVYGSCPPLMSRSISSQAVSLGSIARLMADPGVVASVQLSKPSVT